MSTRFLMLNDQNWLLTLSVIIVTRAVCAQTGERNAIVTNDLSIGERAWPSISNGVVFIDGKYIPPPYVISRNEGEIFLNGLHFDWVIQWPPKKKPIFPLIPAAEPVMPASITKNTTEYDKDYLAYTYYMRHYLMANYGKEKGIEMMVDVYRKLPCIKTAQRRKDDPNAIEVVWLNGSRGGIIQLPPQRGEDHLTKEQAEQFIDKITAIYVRGLENDYYYLTGKGGGRQGSFGGFKQTLTPLVDAMRTAKDETEFLAIMKTNQPVGGMSEAAFRAFYKYKDELPKWEFRLRDATGKKGHR